MGLGVTQVILAICDQSNQRYEVVSTTQDSIQARAEPRVYDIWTHRESLRFATTEQTTITTQEAVFSRLRRPEIFPSQRMFVAWRFQAGQARSDRFAHPLRSGLSETFPSPTFQEATSSISRSGSFSKEETGLPLVFIFVLFRSLSDCP